MAIPSIHILTGKPSGPFGPYRNFQLGGRFFPILVNDYLGCLKSYVLLPFFYIGGISLSSLRLATVLIGASALLAGFFWLKNFAGPATAVLGTLFLATDASYIFYNRHDWGPVSLMFLLKMGTLYFFSRWWKTNRTSTFIWFCVCLALGIYDKANFAWFLFAAAVTSSILWPRGLLRFTAKHLVIAGIFCSLGSYFYIERNLFSDGSIVRMMQGQGVTEISPQVLYRRAAYHFYLLQHTLDGESLLGFSTDQLPRYRSLFPYLFIASVALWLIWPRKSSETAFLLLLTVFIFVAIVLTPPAGGPHHTVMIWPFPHYFVGAIVKQLWESRFHVLKHKVVVMAASTVTLMICLSNLLSVKEYHDTYRAGKASRSWSQEIYQLASFLSTLREKPKYLLDWGIRNNLLFVTQGELDLPEPYWPFLLDPNFAATFAKSFPENGAIYILHSEAATVFSEPRKWFLGLVKKLPPGTITERQLAGGGSIYLILEAAKGRR